MARSQPIVDATPNVKLAARNCARVVLDGYAVALQYARDENKAFDVAVRAWRQHNLSAPPDDAAHEVAAIIRKKLVGFARPAFESMHEKSNQYPS